ncbi:ferritin-like domain-containing protein [Chytridium lagenaria]|nr:ferritin-like domain-containing protein [Chytridium lagenaria]
MKSRRKGGVQQVVSGPSSSNMYTQKSRDETGEMDVVGWTGKMKRDCFRIRFSSPANCGSPVTYKMRVGSIIIFFIPTHSNCKAHRIPFYSKPRIPSSLHSLKSTSLKMRVSTILAVVASAASILALPHKTHKVVNSNLLASPVAAPIAVAAPSVAVSPIATQVIPPKPNIDLNVLNFALTLEHLEAKFYEIGLTKFSEQAFAEAGFKSFVRKEFVNINNHEAVHVDFLTQEINKAFGLNMAVPSASTTLMSLSATLKTLSHSRPSLNVPECLPTTVLTTSSPAPTSSLPLPPSQQPKVVMQPSLT